MKRDKPRMNFRQRIEEYISQQKFGSEPPTLYEPIRYIMALGGKRLRPHLVLLSYSLFKSDPERIISYACAVEEFHNFTLMHDDIMDNAPLRRGKKTVHEKWNINRAILSGDVMLVKVYEIFSSLPGKDLKKVLPLFNSCAAEVCEGQQLDMDFEKRKSVTTEEYIDMIRKKTAVLLGFSLELGAVLASARTKHCVALRELGANIGLAFQLKDDLLDVYGNKKAFGKQVGGDIISNKKTFLMIRALEEARGKNKSELIGWLSKKSFDKREKVMAVSELYDRLSIRELTEDEIKKYFELGLKNLQSIPASSQKEALREFILSLGKREK